LKSISFKQTQSHFKFIAIAGIYYIDFNSVGCYHCKIMETGKIVEYIDRQKIICAVVLEVKQQRLRLLNENNREISLSEGRLLHRSKKNLDISMGRDKVVGYLKETAARRNELLKEINILELWEVLNSEQEWIDLPTMTEFCFPGMLTETMNPQWSVHFSKIVLLQV
jgi:hypothetical protein